MVSKTGSLSTSQVDAWLAVFGEADQRAQDPQPNQATPAATGTPRRISAKLAKHQQNVASAADDAAPELSEEDLELWRRLFGDA